MFAGHFGVATIIKTKEPLIPWWVLMVSSQALDIVFIPLWLLGIETIQKINSGGYGEQIIRANYTHSLIGAGLISVVAGWLAANIWGRRGFWIISGTVFSHWLLDLVVHRSDMPLLPGNIGNFPLLGLGLWQQENVSRLIEGLLVAAGMLLYVKMEIKQKQGSPLAVAGVVLTLGIILVTGLR